MYKIYKPIGKTPLESLQDFKRKNDINEKMCFVGRLDPMAHGDLILLSGENVKNASHLQKADKIYKFQILIGISTDTDDVLGLFTRNSSEYDISRVEMEAQKFNGLSYDQIYHRYSSKPVIVNGKSIALWQLTRDGIHYDGVIPSKRVSIHSMIQLRKFTISDLDKQVYDKLSSLSISQRESFRYEYIINTWEKFFDANKSGVYDILEYEANVSSGTYIRQLVQDISTNCDIPLMVFDIHRTSITI